MNTRISYYSLFSYEDLNIIAKKKRISRICQADLVRKYGLSRNRAICKNTKAGSSLAPWGSHRSFEFEEGLMGSCTGASVAWEVRSEGWRAVPHPNKTQL